MNIFSREKQYVDLIKHEEKSVEKMLSLQRIQLFSGQSNKPVVDQKEKVKKILRNDNLLSQGPNSFSRMKQLGGTVSFRKIDLQAMRPAKIAEHMSSISSQSSSDSLSDEFSLDSEEEKQ